MPNFNIVHDVTGVPSDPKRVKKAQILITSRGNGIKCRNLVFTLISTRGIQWRSQNVQTVPNLTYP